MFDADEIYKVLDGIKDCVVKRTSANGECNFDTSELMVTLNLAHRTALEAKKVNKQ